jgi:hypothetical protein
MTSPVVRGRRVRASIVRSPVLLALSLAAIACSTPAAASPRPSGTQTGLANGAVVDGIQVGEPIDCPVSQPDCETRLTMATAAAIARHDLAPTAIGRARFYLPYLQPGAAYGTGGGAIVVFDLQDGSQAAVHTFCFDGCSVVGVQPVAPESLAPVVDHGPLVDPFVSKPADCQSDAQPMCNQAFEVAIAAATKRGILTAATIADAHYYVTFYAAGSPEATALKAEYLVDVYVAGPHGPTAEVGIAVSCTSGSCRAVSVTDASPP